MSNYSIQECMCRVDFFKPTGKWYTCEEVEFQEWDDGNIYRQFELALLRAVGERFCGMWAVCLEPWNTNSHPLMIKWNPSEVKQ